MPEAQFPRISALGNSVNKEWKEQPLPTWPDPVDWSTRNESGGWGRQDRVLVPGVRRCGVYPVEGVSAGAGR